MSHTVSLPNGMVHVLGRADIRSDAIAFDWTNSGICFRFRGTAAVIHFDIPARSQRLFVQLTVDGIWSRRCVCSDTAAVCIPSLTNGDHTVECIRITEILDAVPIVMRKIEIDGELLPPPPLPTRKMEFIGDSITCGFGVLTKGTGDGYKNDEQDGAHTYAALTAAYFQAQANYICVSGRGIRRNCENVKAPLIPEFIMNTTVSNPVPWNFEAYQPDIVVINAGTNDADGEGIPPADLKPSACAFLKQLRTVYPNACILWVYGMMNTQMNDVLRQAVEEQGDAKMRYLFVSSVEEHPDELGACRHPNLRAHHRFAGIVIDAVSEMTGWNK